MSRRWHWDFEEEQRPPRLPDPPPPLPPPASPVAAPSTSPRARIRRRRGGALLALALVAILAAALSGSGGKRHAPGAAAAAAQAGSHARAGTAPAGGAPKDAISEERQAVAATLAYTPFVQAGSARVREVALTFDDGPGPYTPELLGVLEQNQVHATFFAIGKMERYFSASTVRELRDGDAVGDHTETHPELARLSAREQHEQLLEQLVHIEVLGGPRPRLFRPPYGSFNATTMRELQSLGLLMVLWSVDTQDYLQPGVPAIVQRALAGVQPGGIVLMHDGGGDRSQTIAALPIIVRALHERGYRLVTVPKLLADDPPAHGEPLPQSLAGD